MLLKCLFILQRSLCLCLWVLHNSVKNLHFSHFILRGPFFWVFNVGEVQNLAHVCFISNQSKRINNKMMMTIAPADR
jgi:hypothetical protein